jgi:hypothetical protein
MLMRWVRYAFDLYSPELSIKSFSKSLTRARDSSLNGPRASTAKGTKLDVLEVGNPFVLLVLPRLSIKGGNSGKT